MDFFLLLIFLMIFGILFILYYWQQIVDILAEKLKVQDNVQTIKKQMVLDLDESTSPSPSPSSSYSTPMSKLNSVMDQATNHIAWFLNQPELFFNKIQNQTMEMIAKTLGLSSQNI